MVTRQRQESLKEKGEKGSHDHEVICLATGDIYKIYMLAAVCSEGSLDSVRRSSRGNVNHLPVPSHRMVLISGDMILEDPILIPLNERKCELTPSSLQPFTATN